MNFVDAVEQYTTYLLKLSYLYVKDKQLAEALLSDIQHDVVKEPLTRHTLERYQEA